MIVCFDSLPGTLYTALQGLCGERRQCRIADVPLIRPMRGTAKRELCKEQKTECCRFSHSQDAASASQPCDCSGKMVGPKEMSNDPRYYRRKYGESKENDAPCVQQAHKTCYDRWDTLRSHSANFSHKHLAILNFSMRDRC